MHKVVLLRHGESVWNKENKFTGWVDVDLSENGVIQAEQAGKLLKKQSIVFDIAYTSVLKRAINTLEIALKEMGLENIPVEKSWRLNERHYGALQGLNKKETVKKFGKEQVQAWRRGYKAKPPAIKRTNGNNLPLSESLEDVFKRVIPFWEQKIARSIKQGRTVFVCAHGNSIRALVKWLDKISDQEIEKVNIPIGIPLVYELNDSLKPIKHYYLGNKEQVKGAIKKVAQELKI